MQQGADFIGVHLLHHGEHQHSAVLVRQRADGQPEQAALFLSDEQVGILLDRMDLDVFNYYVDKLSTFILNNGAHVKNHYETILRWWREDSRLEGRL